MIKTFEKYLQKHPPFTDFDANDISPADMIVVIPAYLEDDLKSTLDSLVACEEVEASIAILIVVNASAGSSENEIKHQEETIKEIEKYNCDKGNFNIYAMKAFGLPKKHFGAGLARKIGMDAAVQHFSSSNNEKGIVVSLDADSTVGANYFRKIQRFFKSDKNKACSIYFEHPIQGNEYDQAVFSAIAQYELHLRYYVECLRYIGFPYAVHTVGSCFAFKAASYIAVGGMNRRQGGEEFYFIQKLLQQGGYGELNSTTVYPSPRMSSRVPFGTGPTIKKMVERNEREYMTYNLQCFLDLKVLIENIENYFKISPDTYEKEILNLPGRVRSFLLNSDFYQELKPVNDNCSNVKVFKKRFFHVFNAFKLVKYVNYTHEHFMEKMPVFDAAIELLELKGMDAEGVFEDRELLVKYREMQRWPLACGQ